MLEINTNNYIEAWHNVLKSRYLGSCRKQRTDILVHLLLREVLPDYRIKVARVTMGLDRRRLTDSEKAQLKKCTDLSSEKAASLVRHSVIEMGEAEYSEVILVKSFSNDGPEYLVSLNQASVISRCSCSYMTTSKSVCKHMFLAQAVLGYSISYETRLSKSADICETSLSDPTPEIPTEPEARLESDDRAKALFLERVGFVNSLANGFSRLNDEEIEALNNINAYMAKLKRCRENTDRSWSKRQRR